MFYQMYAVSILILPLDEINKPIAIYLPKSIQSVIANIAITYSANIYMHLDIKNPSEMVQLAAVNYDGELIKWIENPSEQVQLAAVKESRWVIEIIKNPTDRVKELANRLQGLNENITRIKELLK